MAILGDAGCQTFVPKRDYETLQKPLIISCTIVIWISIMVSTIVSLSIVFPGRDRSRPFCGQFRFQHVTSNSVKVESDRVLGAFYMTDQQTVDYYWMVVFIPSLIMFLVSSVYLIPGIIVAYSFPAKRGCLKVVENNYCASKRSGLRCLSSLNVIFAIIYGLLALFLGSSLLTLGSSCSLPLFWCYEISSWGLVIVYSCTAYFLRRKSSAILDSLGMEMSVTTPLQQYSQDVERSVNEGFKAWMGSSLLSSDEDDNDEQPDSYNPTPRQRFGEINGFHPGFSLA